MSQNQQWLNAVTDNFETALLQKNLQLAKDIIADTFDAGFPEQARLMALTLREVDFTKSNRSLEYA